MMILPFETVSPLFEMEKSGEKPFTARRWDTWDCRFKALTKFRQDKTSGRLAHSANSFPAIKITNPQTGESFMRRLLDWDWVRHPRIAKSQPQWAILYLGERLKEAKGGEA